MTPFRTHCIILIQTFLVGCGFANRPVENPIPFRSYDSGKGRTDELIIFLPGRGDDVGAFERSGFIDILQRSNLAADSVVVDAHFGYYRNRSLVDRVYADILVPYCERGYKRFILVGISMGGFGALAINDEYGDLISGMVLMAPFLGKKSLIEQIETAGGVHSWRMQLNPQRPLDPEDLAWIWIDDMMKSDSVEKQTLVIAFGLEDKFRYSANYLSESIPDSEVFKIAGGHNWKTWQSLWLEITNSYSWENLGYTSPRNTNLSTESSSTE